ncbi:MAG: C39 family peptidase [bacterium]|nr:C39 family peptidase [bacterium]
MLARRAILALMLVIIAAGGVHGAAGASVRQATPPSDAFRLEVPYVPQSGALCGGAALAMVLRYWGESGVHAGDFSALVDPARGGISTGSLQGAALARGWDATVWDGSAQGARDLLAEGKPLIVLVQTRSGGFHYVVLVGWNRDGFVVHDPQVGPGRTWSDAAFASAWAGGQKWALLVLPSPNAPHAEPVAAAPTSPRLGRASELFRSGDWAGAAGEAEQALAVAPGDIDAVRLLAGSRFLEGDVDRALRAWNRLAEPRVDLLHVDGARRLRQAVIAAQLDLPPGRLVTPRLYRQARRRLAEIPVAVATRLELRPAAGGITRVDVALLERPLFDATPPASSPSQCAHSAVPKPPSNWQAPRATGNCAPQPGAGAGSDDAWPLRSRCRRRSAGPDCGQSPAFARNRPTASVTTLPVDP